MFTGGVKTKLLEFSLTYSKFTYRESLKYKNTLDSIWRLETQDECLQEQQ